MGMWRKGVSKKLYDVRSYMSKQCKIPSAKFCEGSFFCCCRVGIASGSKHVKLEHDRCPLSPWLLHHHRRQLLLFTVEEAEGKKKHIGKNTNEWQARTMQRHVEKGQCRNQSREILTLKKAVTKSGEPKATSSDKSPCQQQFSGFETQVCKTYFKKNIYGKVSKNTLNYCNPVYSQVIARRRTHLHLEIVAGSSIALPTNRASRVVCFFAVLSFFGVLLSSPFHSFLTYLFTYLSIQFGITFRSVGTNACHRVSYAISQRRSRLWADRQLSN